LAENPIVRYDHFADRWLITHVTYDPSIECVAMSRGPDPANDGWYLYAFDISIADHGNSLNGDYPKIAVWPDGYYLGTYNIGAGTAPRPCVWVLNRQAMLAGKAPQEQHFCLSDGNFLMPSEVDGPAPPLNTPNFLVRQVNESRRGGRDRLEIFQFRVDWTNPRHSKFALLDSIETEPFNSVLCSSEDCVSQPTTGTHLQTLSDRLMWRVQYRNFGSYECLVANHTVNADGHGLAGVRWYELRRVPGGKWSIFQQATFAPDKLNRWIGSIAMDAGGNIAIGYSVSSAKEYPGIRYASRLRADPIGLMSRGEVTLLKGQNSQTDISRWGGYSSMEVDPANPCTFWYANEYIGHPGAFTWKTRISIFTMPSCPETQVPEKLSSAVVSTLKESPLSLDVSVDGHIIKGQGSIRPSQIAPPYYEKVSVVVDIAPSSEGAWQVWTIHSSIAVLLSRQLTSSSASWQVPTDRQQTEYAAMMRAALLRSLEHVCAIANTKMGGDSGSTLDCLAN
jgi:hypothetical protein